MSSSTISYGLPTPEHEPAEFLVDKTEFNCPKSSPEAHSRPEVSRLDANAYTSRAALVFDVVQSMRRSGGCVIQNMMSLDVLSSMERDIRPHLDGVKQASCKHGS